MAAETSNRAARGALVLCGVLLIAHAGLLLAGCASPSGPAAQPAVASQPAEPIAVRFHVATTEETAGHQEEKDRNGQKLFVAPGPFLTEQDVRGASVFRGQRSSVVRLELTPVGAQIVERTTRRHLGEWLVAYVEGKLVMSARITNAVVGGQVYLDGDFSPARADEIARRLNVPTVYPGTPVEPQKTP